MGQAHGAQERRDDDGQHLIERMSAAQAAARGDPLAAGARGAGHHGCGSACGQRQRGARAEGVLPGRGDPGRLDVAAVQIAGHGDAGRFDHLDHDVGVDLHGGLLLHGRRQRAAQFAAVADEQPEQRQRGDRDGREFEPVLERLHERDRPHAAGHHIGDDDRGDQQRPDPDRNAQKCFQGEPGP